MMFGKAAGHIRPYLRLHVPSPEHFTSNPSLLHTLPNGLGSTGTSLVGAKSSPASQTSGGARGAYGSSSNSSAGGGYHGHARAFLSLPQTSSVDPSQSLTGNDDSQQKRRQKRLLVRQQKGEGAAAGSRPGREVRIVDLRAPTYKEWKVLQLDDVPEDSQEDLRRAIEWRSFAATDARALEELELEQEQELEQVAGPSTPRTPPRSKAPSRASSPVSASRRRRPESALGRSRSTVELWQVGLPTPASHSIVRTYSSRASEVFDPAADEQTLALAGEVETDELVVAVTKPTLAKKDGRLEQDLAGVFSTISSIGRPRRYSVAAPQRPSLDDPPNRIRTSTSIPRQRQETSRKADEDDNDRKICDALIRARKQSNRSFAEALIAHYRTPRTTSPFVSEVDSQPAPKGIEHLPLPAGYDVRTYNACLAALLALRRTGESIAPVLDIYNEMLERDVIPNGRTYAHVIQALCTRESEITSSVARWEKAKYWGQWLAANLGTKWDTEQAAEQDALFNSYQAEENAAAALRLFKAAILKHGHGWAFFANTYSHVCEACATQNPPDIQGASDVMRNAFARHRPIAGAEVLYRHIFTMYGRIGDKAGVEATWNAFQRALAALPQVEVNASRAIEDAEDDAQSVSEDDIENREGTIALNKRSHARRMGNIRLAHASAIEAFVNVSDVARANEIFQLMLDSLSASESTSVPVADSATFRTFINSLGQNGHIDEVVQWVEKIASNKGYSSLVHSKEFVSGILDVCEIFSRSGHWSEAMHLLRHHVFPRNNADMPSVQELRSLRSLYATLLVAARSTEDEVSKHAVSCLRTLSAQCRSAIDFELLDRHVDILREHGSYRDIRELLDILGAQTFPAAVVYRIQYALRAALSSSSDFADLLSLVRSADTCGLRLIGDSAAALVQRYVDERGKVLDVAALGLGSSAWPALMSAFLGMPQAPLREGDFDQALELYMADLARTGEENLQAVFDQSDLGKFAQDILVYRFGRDRTVDMLKGFLPATAVGRLVPRPKIDIPRPVSSTSEASASLSGTDTESTAGPVTPTSMASDPALVPTPVSPWKLDDGLSAQIDRHTQPRSPITPNAAYDLIVRAVQTSLLPHPASLSRLIINLSRTGASILPQISHLYSLSQQAIPLLPPQEHQRSWRQVEDAMLIANCHMGLLEQAGLHRARIVEQGMVPSADAYATMIASSKDTTDDALVARDLWTESQSMGVKPTLFLYNTIISKLSKARKAELALELFAHMRAHKVTPSSVTYGAIINACCRVGDAESAETLFAEMASQPNFKPRVPPFNTMMQFYLQTRPSREKVLQYYHALLAARVPPSAHTYKLLLDAFATLEPIDLVSMERVFADIQADPHVQVQGTHWASLISAYGIGVGNVTKALEIFDSIPTHPSSASSVPEPVVWESILSVLALKGTVEELESVRLRMTHSRVQPTAYVYNVLITGYARAGLIDKARDVFEGMGDSITGVAAPNNHPQLLTSSGHVKPSTVTSESRGMVYREPSTYEAMIHAEIKCGDRQAAEAVLRRMESRGYPAAVYMRARAALDGMHHGVSQGQQGQAVWTPHTPHPLGSAAMFPLHPAPGVQEVMRA